MGKSGRPVGTATVWTDDKVYKLHRLYTARVAVKVIAHRLRVTEAAVRIALARQRKRNPDRWSTVYLKGTRRRVIQVAVQGHVYKELQAEAKARQTTLSAYVEMLIMNTRRANGT